MQRFPLSLLLFEAFLTYHSLHLFVSSQSQYPGLISSMPEKLIQQDLKLPSDDSIETKYIKEYPSQRASPSAIRKIISRGDEVRV